MLRLPSPFVLKAWCGGIGLGAGIVGIALEQRWLVWVAMILLGAAFLLRFARRSRPDA
ncbi:MAG TPA: hypothetical protein VJ816_00565 [Gemmatimonadales bacterium]|nr:hypothetical protein [Gemmatimonadales bacterium]